MPASEKYVRKGTQLYVEGKLRTRTWTDQSGNKKDRTEIIADTFQLLGKRSDNPGAPAPGGYQPTASPYQPQPQQPSYQSTYQPAVQEAQPAAPPVSAPEGEDDLPF